MKKYVIEREAQLPRAAYPEEVGIDSRVLRRIVDDLTAQNLELHTLMVLRHGKVAFETYRAPYAPQYPHVMFSVSKSVTSCAVGFAVSEGRLTLETPVLEIIPELCADENQAFMRNMTVWHLITMTAGKVMSYTADKRKNQWIQDFADARWNYAPGEGWNYCNENIYLLCVILHRVCGCSVVEYLTPRLFEPLHIPVPVWETDGSKIEAGGWGLQLTTESLAKITLCYTQGGVFDGKQVIPADWVAASGSAQVMQPMQGDRFAGNGYGYCHWINPYPNSFRSDGVFSQAGIVFLDESACIVYTGGEAFADKVLDCVFLHVPDLFCEPRHEPAIDAKSIALPAYQTLYQTPRSVMMERFLDGKVIHFAQAAQTVPELVGYPVSVMPFVVFFMSAEKAGGVNFIRMRFEENALKFSWSEGDERNTILCGMDGVPRVCKIKLGGLDFIVASEAAWEGGSKLHVWVRPLGSVAQRRMTFTFRGNQVRMLPRSNPALHAIADFFEPFLHDTVGNPVIATVAAKSLSKVAMLAEPLHIGTVR
ncbi:MAG: beta-lactamase family protein [Oscillospiraceae bacterium]|jgi:CubicO group peptidase (beta-lactamase class C family)|nr:beta-lactamase family protein [Oscillospiraceae bacterium]